MLSDFHVLSDHWPDIVNGIGMTLLTWVLSVVAGIAIGLVIALTRAAMPRPIRIAVDAFTISIRGTPFLVQLFLLYYGGPFVGISLPPVTAGIIGLTVHASAYFAEIFRSGLGAVSTGQVEAASMSGLSKTQTFYHVSLPQMMIVIFPSLMNMVIILLKETAVLSVITVSELTATLSTIGSTTFAYVPTLGFLALFYWVSLELLSSAGRLAEARMSRYLVR